MQTPLLRLCRRIPQPPRRQTLDRHRKSSPPIRRPPRSRPRQGPQGLRFDFNDGCRLMLPESEHPWRVRLSDLDTGNILFETEIKAGRVNSSKRYFVRFRLEVWQQDESVLSPRLFRRRPRGADPVPGRHARRHARLVSLCGEVQGAPRLPAHLRHGREAHPAVSRRLSGHHLSRPTRRSSPSATTPPTASGCSSTTRICVHQPCDFRHVGLHRTAGYILGVDPTEAPPRIALADDSRPIAEPYVCIAVQSTTQAKYWNNPDRLARDRPLPQGGRLPRRLHRPEADRTAPASSGTTSRTAPRTRPATGRSPSARAGSSTRISSSASPAACPGSPGRSARRW